MGQTITEKILAKHAGKKSVVPGELIKAKVDIVLGNDITAPVAINEFYKIGVNKVFAKDRICLIPDHFTPNKDIKSAEQVKMLREFAKEMGIVHFYDVGKMGVEHALLPEMGIVGPGDLIIGADSHTCTYGALGAFSTGVGSTDMAAAMATGEAWFKVPSTIKFTLTGKKQKWVSGKDVILYIIGLIGVDGALYQSMEFTGDIKQFSIDERFTIANMAIEAGAKNGIFHVDDITLAYVKGRTLRNYEIYESDKDANYAKEIVIDLNKIEPQVAFPHLPENTKPVREAKGIKIDQVIIGSCTNGRIEDLQIAAQVLKGHKVADGVRCIIIPATQQIYREAMEQGLFDIFLDADAAISTPTCGPCLGGHMGILAKGERAVATTNRNFVGRMGHIGSEVYLANPAIAAASAITGTISSPDDL
ncbi:MAG: 3-isopropylmalate dehydratase large subunit [Candidatus Margulisbacteria bacterium GWF2_35_9]|nr:MAG: 3-isopropylmalate dehydratase large subunit [Candidatus Margulisbacteria bacterium GWF2_35_9]